MSMFQQFREILLQRLQAILWRSVASTLETDAALWEVDNLDRVEECARRLESEGKSNLAESLRTRAAQIDVNSPGGSIEVTVQRLAKDVTDGRLLLDDSRNQPEKTLVNAPPTANGRAKRRRPRAKDKTEIVLPSLEKARRTKVKLRPR